MKILGSNMVDKLVYIGFVFQCKFVRKFITSFHTAGKKGEKTEDSTEAEPMDAATNGAESKE